MLRRPAHISALADNFSSRFWGRSEVESYGGQHLAVPIPPLHLCVGCVLRHSLPLGSKDHNDKALVEMSHALSGGLDCGATLRLRHCVHLAINRYVREESADLKICEFRPHMKYVRYYTASLILQRPSIAWKL